MVHSTRAATYKVIINTLKGLPRTQKDAAFGITGLVFLYALRMSCDYFARKYPRRGEPSIRYRSKCANISSLSARFLFFISVLRNAFVIFILTIASWLYTRHRISKSGKTPIKILGPVPRGFQHVHALHVDPNLVSALASQLPVATIILLLEHIAISKCAST
jgi:solute carrier family 26 (sodium-independent sulfate anion transporter), member 11